MNDVYVICFSRQRTPATPKDEFDEVAFIFENENDFENKIGVSYMEV